MEGQINEVDWKLLRRLQPIALERFCQRVLAGVSRLASNHADGSHARYLELCKLIQKRDEELGSAFDDVKRSTALMRLAQMRVLGLVTDEEFAEFTSQTQATVALFLQNRRRRADSG